MPKISLGLSNVCAEGLTLIQKHLTFGWFWKLLYDKGTFIFFSFKINNLLHGARRQTMVAKKGAKGLQPCDAHCKCTSYTN